MYYILVASPLEFAILRRTFLFILITVAQLKVPLSSWPRFEPVAQVLTHGRQTRSQLNFYCYEVC
jgi:hypothetical protein